MQSRKIGSTKRIEKMTWPLYILEEIAYYVVKVCLLYFVTCDKGLHSSFSLNKTIANNYITSVQQSILYEKTSSSGISPITAILRSLSCFWLDRIPRDILYDNPPCTMTLAYWIMLPCRWMPLQPYRGMSKATEGIDREPICNISFGCVSRTLITIISFLASSLAVLSSIDYNERIH